jgi:hypothetical protein
MCIALIVARQRLGKMYLLSLLGNGSVNKFSGKDSLCRPCLDKGESLVLCIILSFLFKNSVKKLPLQRRIVGVALSYAIHAVSKESKRVVLPRTSCLKKTKLRGL